MKILIIFGPSGAGKSTLIKKLIEEYGECCDFSISHTTRDKRPNEAEGKDYYFVKKEDFKKLEFYEEVDFNDRHYGTSKNTIRQIVERKKLPILDVNVKSIPKLAVHKELELTSVFIKPALDMEESLKVIEGRLKSRSKTTKESPDVIRKRVDLARQEIKESEEEHRYDFRIINKDLTKAFSQLENIVLSLVAKMKKESHCHQNGTVSDTNGFVAGSALNGFVKPPETNCAESEENSDEIQSKEEIVTNNKENISDLMGSLSVN